MPKTPEYTKRAVNNYRQKFDFIQVRFPKGTREKLMGKGNINNYIVECVLNSLDGAENAETDAKVPTEDNTPKPQIRPNLERLYELYGQKIKDIYTQLEIQEKYGNETLVALSEYAQNKENKDN